MIVVGFGSMRLRSTLLSLVGVRITLLVKMPSVCEPWHSATERGLAPQTVPEVSDKQGRHALPGRGLGKSDENRAPAELERRLERFVAQYAPSASRAKKDVSLIRLRAHLAKT